MDSQLSIVTQKAFCSYKRSIYHKPGHLLSSFCRHVLASSNLFRVQSIQAQKFAAPRAQLSSRQLKTISVYFWQSKPRTYVCKRDLRNSTFISFNFLPWLPVLQNVRAPRDLVELLLKQRGPPSTQPRRKIHQQSLWTVSVDNMQFILFKIIPCQKKQSQME